MEHVNVGTQLIPVILSLVCVIILAIAGKDIKKNTLFRSFWLSCLVFVSLYFLLMITSTVNNIYNLNNYEQGIFDSAAEEEKAMRKVVDDTAVQLAFISSAILSFIISFFVLIVSLVRLLIFKRESTKNIEVN